MTLSLPISLLLLLLYVQQATARFSEGFYQFLVAKYGEEAAISIDRPDLGDDGSFGGGDSVIGVVLK